MRQIWHPWTEWECYASGMYDGACDLGPVEGPKAYAEFLSDIPRFKRALDRVLIEWPISCEHFLSNEKINRIAWLGQAAMCMDSGIPRRHRAGFRLLSDEQQAAANRAAQEALSRWTNERATEDCAV